VARQVGGLAEGGRGEEEQGKQGTKHGGTGRVEAPPR
jgi:hypothetical protein